MGLVKPWGRRTGVTWLGLVMVGVSLLVTTAAGSATAESATRVSATARSAATEIRGWASPHQEQLEAHRQQPLLAALVGAGGMPQVPLRSRAKRAGGRQAEPASRTVFGYLPYWIDAEYYAHLDLDILTHISAFSVEVNADGTLGDDHGWPWTALIDRAHAHGVKVILTATLFGNDAVLTLLNSEVHRQTFLVAIRDKLKAGHADGVNIDFEGTGANGWPSLINAFLRELSTFLHAEIPGCEVSFAGPAVDWGHRYDFPGLAASCDYIFIMGYAFSGSWSDHTGPTAPLIGGSRNITTTITDDYGAVTAASPEKLILGVPYYGTQWRTRSDVARAEVVDFVRYLHLSATLRDAAIHGRQWDVRSRTPWYGYEDNDGFYQVWYDDAQSLGLKYELALSHGLRGVGMWALGYDGERREPWDLLAAMVGHRQTAIMEASAETRPAMFGLTQNVPNPFNQSTRITFSVPAPGTAELEIFDVLGRRLGQWRFPDLQAGTHGWCWSGRTAAGTEAGSGVYLYQLRFTWGTTRVMRTRMRRMVLCR